MKNKIALATLAILPMATSNSDASTIGTVTASSLNVRSGPSTSYTVVTSVKKNEKVSILQSSNGWYKIETTSGKQGWASSSYISISNNSTNNTDNTSTTTATVNTDGLNFRNGAGTSYSVIKVLNKGDKVEVISESNGWSKVKHDSRLGYVSSKYIDKNNLSYTIKEVSTDSLNVRTGPGTSYAVIGKLNTGAKVEVISENNGWSKINYNNITAYVSSGYLKMVSTSTQTPTPNPTPDINTEDKTENYKEIKLVNTDNLNVRKGPGTSYESIGKLNTGAKVEVISESNGWSKINYNKTTAYVATRYLDSITNNEQVPPVVEDNNTQAGNGTNISGATINYKQLSYTLEDHINLQYKKALEGGNLISSNLQRGYEEEDDLMASNMIQSRAYVSASKGDLEYFLDPDNFRYSDKGMMQFLRLDTYKGGITESELNSYLNSLAKVNGKNSVFYNQAKSFINAAKKYNVDLVYLVAHAMLETGYGKSVLAQGQTITSYKGTALASPVTVYNFYGIGAIDKSANVSGAEAAYSNGWTSIEKAIEGAASWISSNYIHSSKYEQNTLYKMRFNYHYTWHQYATDVNWANGISGIMYKIVSMYDTADNLTFEIPDYR